VAVVTPAEPATFRTEALLAACRASLPGFMVPARIELRAGGLPRNPNGKIDRSTLRAELDAPAPAAAAS